jgi:hypothetical protein
MRYFLGVDPGASGGIAAISEAGRVYLLPLKDLEPQNIWEWLNRFRGPDASFHCHGVLELVGGFVAGREGMKHGGQPGHHMFNFGKSVGVLVGLLIAADIPFTEIAPRSWQKSFGIASRDHKGEETQPQFKARLKEFAQTLYPSVKLTLQTCDSLLLAEYCRKTWVKEDYDEGLALPTAL